ncbi:uncharacterized protein BDZ99DRAFT_57838 [Mytilinidion resinicola]|uniref:Uncharacterized protein n=1 Tax=Mytilinidion resinicola TaxID=574789 RepID=A0A6A6YJ08_9PEZI|nr:uncharacterized protein BDZ99DRAFT_57838 [Mytilinidion resinicola]KAF2808549.1 hypothetical protein BDZ99DRAFT_57838 [Mytilinidion resinicola]
MPSPTASRTPVAMGIAAPVLVLVAFAAAVAVAVVALADEESVLLSLFELDVALDAELDAVVRVVDITDGREVGVADDGVAVEGVADSVADVGVAAVGEDSADVPAEAWETVAGTGVKGLPQEEVVEAEARARGPRAMRRVVRRILAAFDSFSAGCSRLVRFEKWVLERA